MATPYLSEIRIFSFSFAPKGWALCNGQLLPINQNQAMFSLLGTTYGGDGRVNFGLAESAGPHPHTYGQRTILLDRTGGEQNHTLSIPEIPSAHPYLGRHQHRRERAQSDLQSAGRGSRIQQLRDQSRGHVPGCAGDGRGQPAASEYAALPHAEFLHRAAGNIPQPELAARRTRHGKSVCSRNKDIPVQLRAHRMGLLQRPASAHLPEHGAFLAAGDHLWRRWEKHLCAS